MIHLDDGHRFRRQAQDYSSAARFDTDWLGGDNVELAEDIGRVHGRSRRYLANCRTHRRPLHGKCQVNRLCCVEVRKCNHNMAVLCTRRDAVARRNYGSGYFAQRLACPLALERRPAFSSLILGAVLLGCNKPLMYFCV